jgi:acetoin utilization protein AcuB
LASMLEVITVGDVMVQAPISVTPDTSVEEAARLVHEHRIGGMPVLEGEKLVGVLTVNDLLSAFIVMLGLLRSSSRLDLLLDNKPKTLEKVSRLIQDTGGQIINIALGPTQDDKRCFFFRLEKCDLAPIITNLKGQGYQVLDFID